MRIENIEKQMIKDFCKNLSSKLLTHPLFMYYCPEKAVRHDFINAYFNHYLTGWAKDEILLCNENSSAIVTIVNPTNYKYKFSGKGAGAMKEYRLSPNIFEHHNENEEIFDVVVPASREGRIMTVYANINTEFNDIVKLVDEAEQLAKQENFVLLYDTFSARLQPLMKEKDFKLVYNKNFLSTDFTHSMMVYNF